MSSIFLLALLEQEGGLAQSVLAKAGVNWKSSSPADRAIGQAAARFGRRRRHGQIYVTPRLADAADAAGERSQAAEGRLRFGGACSSGRPTDEKVFKDLGVTRERLMRTLQEVRGTQRVTTQNPEATYEALEKYGRDLTKLAAQRQARSGDRARRRDSPRDPGSVAAHQEQPGADRRAGRRQDGHRRRSSPAHHARRRAGGIER